MSTWNNYLCFVLYNYVNSDMSHSVITSIWLATSFYQLSQVVRKVCILILFHFYNLEPATPFYLSVPVFVPYQAFSCQFSQENWTTVSFCECIDPTKNVNIYPASFPIFPFPLFSSSLSCFSFFSLFFSFPFSPYFLSSYPFPFSFFFLSLLFFFFFLLFPLSL